MNKRRWLLLGLFLAIALLVALTKPLAISFHNTINFSDAQAIEMGAKPQPIGTKVPSQVLTCVPNEGAKYELLGTVLDRDTTYHLLSIYEYADEDPKERWDVLIQQDQAGCLLLHHLGSGLKPLSAYMPLEIAQQLELQRYQHWIAKAGGKEKFQSVFSSQFSDSDVPRYLSAEQVCALTKLNIQLPQTYKILNANP